jgi:hypothetical protein
LQHFIRRHRRRHFVSPPPPQSCFCIGLGIADYRLMTTYAILAAAAFRQHCRSFSRASRRNLKIIAKSAFRINITSVK